MFGLLNWWLPFVTICIWVFNNTKNDWSVNLMTPLCNVLYLAHLSLMFVDKLENFHQFSVVWGASRMLIWVLKNGWYVPLSPRFDRPITLSLVLGFSEQLVSHLVFIGIRAGIGVVIDLFLSNLLREPLLLLINTILIIYIKYLSSSGVGL